MKLTEAIFTSAKAHVTQVDKGGEPYIFHAIRVSANLILKSEDEKVVGMLHDVVEDGKFTIEELIANGLTAIQADMLDKVTRREGETWSAYVSRICTDESAIRIKISDLEDNMDVKRLTSMSTVDAKRILKYHSLWRHLRRLLEDIENGR